MNFLFYVYMLYVYLISKMVLATIMKILTSLVGRYNKPNANDWVAQTLIKFNCQLKLN